MEILLLSRITMVGKCPIASDATVWKERYPVKRQFQYFFQVIHGALMDLLKLVRNRLATFPTL